MAFCVSLVVTLFAIEIVLRMVFVAPRLVAANYPHGAGIAGSELRLAQSEYDIRLRYNRFGFRGDEFPLDKEPGELRILVLGDSFAEGVGVAEEDRFADLLERDLAARSGRKVAVLVAGQMATGPKSYVQNLIDFGVALRPDLVILAIYIGNDFSLKVAAPGPQVRVNETLPPEAAVDDGAWTSVLRLAFLRRGVAQLVSGRALLFRPPSGLSPWEIGYGKPVSRQYYVDTLGLFGVKPEEVDAATAGMDQKLVAEFYAGRINPAFFLVAAVEHAARMRGRPPPAPAGDAAAGVTPVVNLLAWADEMLSARGIGLLILVIPDVHEMETRAHRAFLAKLAIRPSRHMRRTGAVRRAFVRELRARSIATLDLAAALRSSGERTFHIMDGHFNEAGHRIAAGELVDHLDRAAARIAR